MANEINKHIESKDRATVLSTVSMMERILQSISYLIAGFLSDMSLYLAFIIMGIIIFSSAVFSRLKK